MSFGIEGERNLQARRRRAAGFGGRAAGGTLFWWMLACMQLLWCSKAIGMTATIQEHGRDAAAVPVVEFLRLGDADSGDSILFGSISSVAVSSTGRIFVGEGQDPKVHVYSGNGKHLTTLGSRGAAPGEFSAVTSVYIGPGDSLYVFDGWDRTRLTVFEPAQFQLAYTVSIRRSAQGWRAVDFLGVTSEAIVMTYYRPKDVGAETEERFSEVYRVDWNGEISSERLLNIERQEVLVVAIPPGGARSLGYPFGRASTIRLGPDHMLYSGWNDAIDIAKTGLDGAVHGHIAHPQSPVSVTAADRRAIFQRRGGDAIRARVSARDMYDTWPVYKTFVVDEHGSVWIELVEKDEKATTSWLVIDADGELTGIADLPATFELSAVRSGRIYGTDRSESGAPIVVGYQSSN